MARIRFVGDFATCAWLGVKFQQGQVGLPTTGLRRTSWTASPGTLTSRSRASGEDRSPIQGVGGPGRWPPSVPP